MRYLKTDCCCCIFSLQSGGLILGWLGLICSIGGLCRSIYNISKSSQHTKQLGEIYFTPEQILIASAIGILVSACFLYGIYHRRSSFLLPYVILSVISIGFFMIILIIVVLVVMYVIATETTRLAEVWSFYFILITMAVLLPTIALCWHFAAVAYSLYQNIKEVQEHPSGVAYSADDSYKV